MRTLDKQRATQCPLLYLLVVSQGPSAQALAKLLGKEGICKR